MRLTIVCGCGFRQTSDHTTANPHHIPKHDAPGVDGTGTRTRCDINHSQ